MRTLLSVDWDFFFPRAFEMKKPAREALGHSPWLYDWGHRETMFFLGPIWGARAQSFYTQGVDPLPTTTGDEVGFWEQFNINPDAKLYVAESHASIWELLEEGYGAVYNYDAHHDAGYGTKPDDLWEYGEYDCGTWAVAFHLLGAKIEQRYPSWADTKREKCNWVPVHAATARKSNRPVLVDDIFLCRSGCWVPPWVDQDFINFAQAAPVTIREVFNAASVDPMQAREFNPDIFKSMAGVVEALGAASG